MKAGTPSIVVASDHAGVRMKRRLGEALRSWGYAVEDLGPESEESVDYPDFAEKVARRISGGGGLLGVLVCGTGIGMSIAANKFPGVRAALLYDDFAARHARLHNDANVAVFGARTMREEEAEGRLKLFLDAAFESGRHAARLEKISRFEGRPGRATG
ncbi:MAG: ribose 5-phosphate isomerase B [Gemmatimonadota bacterium]